MRYSVKILAGVILLLLFAGNSAFCQSDEESVFSQSDEKETSEEPTQVDAPKFYFGVGMGFDYGGIFGIKAEYLPIKYFGIFGGVGYNLLSVGWNAGLTCKTLPDKQVSPNLMVFFGYNAVVIIDNYSEYNMTSYGVSFGVNLDIKIKRNKLSIGLFFPIRSSEFKEHYHKLENDPNIVWDNKLLPIAFGVGFNFGI
ncbi:MAG: hypothetical protein FWH36_02555 [Lentimicrobiaceae bacterium]|nr:hypothetical protein [Lentimicrobiaceae bacterium]